MKVCVLVRQLKPHDPVVMNVFLPPDEKVDNLDSYFKYKAAEAISTFKTSFVEFRNADFHFDIVETN